MAGNEESWTTKAEDAAAESVVLMRILDLHPSQVTVAELAREIAGEGAGFAERDSLERAIRDLSGVGLLHRNDDFVLPTRAALRFNELLNR
jgi:hypothetical protein